MPDGEHDDNSDQNYVDCHNCRDGVFNLDVRKRRASKAIGPNQIRDGAYNEQQKDSANPAYGCLFTPVANTLPRSVLRHSLIIGADRIRCILPQGANITGPRGNGRIVSLTSDTEV